MDFKKICYIVISICIILLGIKALVQSNGETAKYFDENMVIVEDGKYHEENNGKVVAIKGTLATDEFLKDEKFGVIAKNTPRLERKVLEYRYYNSKKNTSYSEDETNIKRSKIWKTRWEDKATVAEFVENDGYQMGEMLDSITQDKNFEDIKPETFTLNPLLNNELEIPQEKLLKFPCNTPVVIDSTNEQLVVENYSNTFKLKNNEFTTVTGNSPVVGDIRVSFRYLDLEKLGTVTVVAKQEDGKLVEYEGENSDIVFEVYKGDLSKEEILNKMKEDDNYAKMGVAITFLVIIIIGMIIFRYEIGDFLDKKNIHIKLSNNMLQGMVFLSFLLFFLGTLAITINVVKRTVKAQAGIPVEATVTSYREEFHGSQTGYYYTYEYIVDDELYENEYNNADSIPFDPTKETEDGSIAKFEAYYDKDNPSISYIPKDRVHNIAFYAACAFFFALFIIGMVKTTSNIIEDSKKNKSKV